MDALKRVDAGLAVPDVCRELDISSATFLQMLNPPNKLVSFEIEKFSGMVEPQNNLANIAGRRLPSDKCGQKQL
jgi:hypothetical protein